MWGREETGIYDRNMGPGLVCRTDISVLNIIVETPASPFFGPNCVIRS